MMTMMKNLTYKFSWPVGAATCVALATTGYLVSSWRKERKDHQQNLLLESAPKPPAAASKKSSKQCTVLVVGGGTIGSGFASVFLARGMKVIISDPFTTQQTLESRIRGCWPSIVARGLTTKKEPPFESLQKIDDLEEATSKVQGIDFVQECVFEEVELKQSVLARLDSLVDPSVLIASSTSFIPWTLLFYQCQHKHRLLIGHPILPDIACFVEIYGISPQWTAHCKEWYTKAGFDVIVMKKSIPGHVLYSFLQVNMDHGHKLERQGVCSPEDVNMALRHLARLLYGHHLYLSILTGVGGDRGFEGGLTLGTRIRSEAAFLVLFSSMKDKGYPDFVARPMAKYLGRCITKLMPSTPEVYLAAARALDEKITKNGTIPPQVALFNHAEEMFKLVPLEVGNDPLGIE
jgi:carnitine 3-dehydrogenase